MIGLDLLEIDRLEEALARRPALAERLFTDGERSYAATLEAYLGWLAIRDIEVVGGGGGPPRVALHGEVAARAASLGVEVPISLTHTTSTAAAVAVLR